MLNIRTVEKRNGMGELYSVDVHCDIDGTPYFLCVELTGVAEHLASLISNEESNDLTKKQVMLAIANMIVQVAENRHDHTGYFIH